MTEEYTDPEVDKYSITIDKNFINSYLREFNNNIDVPFKEKMLTLLKDFLNKKELYYDDEQNKKVKCNLVIIDLVKILNTGNDTDKRPFYISPCYTGVCLEGTNTKIFTEKIYTSGLTNEENDEFVKLINYNKPQVSGGKPKSRRSNKKRSNKNKKRSNKKKSNKRKTHRRR